MKTCWSTSANSISGSKKTRLSKTTAAMGSVVIGIPMEVAMADIPANKHPRPQQAHPGSQHLQLQLRELAVAQLIIARSMRNITGLTRTPRMVATRTMSLTTNTTNKWPSNSNKCSSLRMPPLLRHLLHPAKLLPLLLALLALGLRLRLRGAATVL